MNVKEKLDLLAEFHSKRDSLELEKRELLNEIQVPADVEQIVKQGMARQAEMEANTRKAIDIQNAKIDEEIAAVFVPAELKEALAELDAQRAKLMAKFADVEKQRQEITNKKRENEIGAMEALAIRKRALLEEIEAQTRQVYNDINQRKNEIEAEFSGKAEDVAANISKLENEIKDDLKKEAAEKLEKDPKAKDLSVKGKYFHAVYVRGRVTWNTDKMDAWVVDHPFLKEARKEGDPSITIRKV